MKTKNLHLVLIAFATFNFQLLTFNCLASTTVPAGNVSGTWTLAGSPYNVQGSIQILDGTTLTIQPGVTINFLGTFKLNVQGRLLAIGTVADTIIFTAANITNGWRGIRFDQTPTTNDSSKIIYCKLQYGKATGSSPDDNGGAFYFNSFSHAIVSHCKISTCLANTGGGGIYCEVNSGPIITYNTFSNNSALNAGGGIICFTNSNPMIAYNTFTNNIGAGNGGAGIACIGTSPIINGNIFSNNNALQYGGGAVWCNGGSPIISNNIISNNSAGAGGGICCINSSNPNIINNTITNNTSSGSGGGIFCYGTSNPIMTNNTIANNSGLTGGALYCDGGSDPKLRNVILYGNTASTSGGQVFLNDESSDPNFYYCDVQGGVAAFELNGNIYSGTYQNNIDTDPKFVSPSGGSGTAFNGVSADWSLQSNSPCINTGDPIGTYPAKDIAENTRVTVCRIDMGAYEFQNGIPLSATISQGQQSLCYGDSTATATIIAAGGSGTYTYAWSTAPVQTGATAIGLKATTYTVTVTETSYSCSVTKTITITQPQQIIFTPIPNPVLCKNGNTGSITGINALGGTGTFYYSKDSGLTYQSANIFAGLTAGTYQVVVKDGNNCVTPAQSIVITEPPLLAFTTTHGNVLCKNGNSGNDTITATGGTGTKQYSKDGGITYQASNIFAGLTANTYQITVKDSNNCVAPIQNVIITEPTLLTFTTAQKNVLCYSGNSGSDTVYASGGTGIYKYSNDGGSNYQSSNIFAGLVASTYQIIVKDSNNCITTAQADVILQPNSLPSATFTTQNESSSLYCDGSIKANLTGGTGTIQPQWLDSIQTVLSNTDSIGGLCPHTYTLHLTDANGCTNTYTQIIQAGPVPPTPPICLVTVDSTYTHNVIVWEKTNLNMTAIDSFIVYREVGTNNYHRIGAVLHDSMSTFDDLGANPASTGFRYKLKSKNTHGVTSLFSDYHNTIYLTNNGGNFSWTPYQIENNTTPVYTYNVYRDDNSNGNFQTIGNTTGNQFGYTDVNFSSFPNASYYVEAVLTAGNCHPTRSGYAASRSNVKHFGTTGIQQLDNNSVIKIYPNPASNTVMVTGITGKTTIRIYDMVGKLVYENSSPLLGRGAGGEVSINTSQLAEGIYSLVTESKTGRAFNKVVISR